MGGAHGVGSTWKLSLLAASIPIAPLWAKGDMVKVEIKGGDLDLANPDYRSQNAKIQYLGRARSERSSPAHGHGRTRVRGGDGAGTYEGIGSHVCCQIEMTDQEWFCPVTPFLDHNGFRTRRSHGLCTGKLLFRLEGESLLHNRERVRQQA